MGQGADTDGGGLMRFSVLVRGRCARRGFDRGSVGAQWNSGRGLRWRRLRSEGKLKEQQKTEDNLKVKNAEKYALRSQMKEIEGQLLKVGSVVDFKREAELARYV
ncbi:hypothetical protein RJT34_00570 [Clitoria ternatea]|uniref:Uncharacterized protein n=1 Tax=Clitoria ternatea TaxID=43366 RepID=A0AAN9KIH5_CLITE